MSTNKIQTYERHSTAPLAEVLALIGLHYHRPEKSERVEINGIPVYVNSKRLKTFYKHGTTCSCCGVQATHFALERSPGPSQKSIDAMPAKARKKWAEKPPAPYHLNMWGTNAAGEPVLFTHDHTLARSLGGKDDVETNTTTMCCWCNWEKGEAERQLLAERKAENGIQD